MSCCLNTAAPKMDIFPYILHRLSILVRYSYESLKRVYNPDYFRLGCTLCFSAICLHFRFPHCRLQVPTPCCRETWMSNSPDTNSQSGYLSPDHTIVSLRNQPGLFS